MRRQRNEQQTEASIVTPAQQKILSNVGRKIEYKTRTDEGIKTTTSTLKWIVWLWISNGFLVAANEQSSRFMWLVDFTIDIILGHTRWLLFSAIVCESERTRQSTNKRITIAVVWTTSKMPNSQNSKRPSSRHCRRYRNTWTFSFLNRKWFPKSTKIYFFFFLISNNNNLNFRFNDFLGFFHFQGTFTLIVEAWHDSNETTTRSPGKFWGIPSYFSFNTTTYSTTQSYCLQKFIHFLSSSSSSSLFYDIFFCLPSAQCTPAHHFHG